MEAGMREIGPGGQEKAGGWPLWDLGGQKLGNR